MLSPSTISKEYRDDWHCLLTRRSSVRRRRPRLASRQSLGPSRGKPKCRLFQLGTVHGEPLFGCVCKALAKFGIRVVNGV
jgi:hypothetical protein